MPNKLTFDAEGVQEMVSAMAGAGLMAVANQIVENAQAEAPVLTGFLKEHIKVQDGASDLDVTVRSEAPYSKFQEEGTSFHGAQPFFEQAYKGRKDELKSAFIRGTKGK